MSAAIPFDFDAAVTAPFRMQPGLRRLAPGAAQLTPSVVPGRGTARHLREKLAVLWAFPQQALLASPGFDAGPALQALAAQAAAEHPDAWRIELDGSGTASGPRARWHAPWLGWAVDAQDEPQPTGHDWPEIGTLLRALPRRWRRTGLLSLAFAEDFAIVDGPEGWIPWLAVALPSMWAPEEKLGLRFAEVHAPVADNRLIQAAAERLVQLVTDGADGARGSADTQRSGGSEAPEPARWERFVWTLTGHRRLHAHPQRMPAPRWAPELLTDPARADELAAQTWLRTERQTFIPVPGMGQRPQAVFNIAVDTRPLPEVVAEAPGRAARLHEALASMSPAVLAYRGLDAARAPLLHWLSRQA